MLLLAVAVSLVTSCSEDKNDSSSQTKPVQAGAPCNAQGATAPADDGCNTCVCDMAAWACTEKACVEPCEDGATKPADDGCNTCTCQAGQWQCTLLGCVSLNWYSTCGDPVCGPNSDVATGQPPCTETQSEGGGCDAAGTLCDPGVGCGTNLVCASSDPKLAPGGCPISRARFKRDIEYLTDSEREQLAEELLATPLATFAYRGARPRRQLGFVIEDIEPSPAVDGQRDRVDLYGYTTMAVAALQQQAVEIERLRRELRELRHEVQAAESCVSE
jgi:hypothetical protein